jgi:hypothetical protein
VNTFRGSKFSCIAIDEANRCVYLTTELGPGRVLDLARIHTLAKELAWADKFFAGHDPENLPAPPVAVGTDRPADSSTSPSEALTCGWATAERWFPGELTQLGPHIARVAPILAGQGKGQDVSVWLSELGIVLRTL